MTRIVLSYRRNDQPIAVAWIHEHLANHYGSDQVFIDVADMVPGKNFRQHLSEVLGQADVLIVVIGSKWLEADANGDSRLVADPDDHVRFEIQTALERDMIIIPLLLDGAKMPRAAVLPADFASFALLHAAELQTRETKLHVYRLMTNIERLIDERTPTAGMTVDDGRLVAQATLGFPAWLIFVIVMALIGVAVFVSLDIQVSHAPRPERTNGPTDPYAGFEERVLGGREKR